MKKVKIIAAACFAFALCFALFGCGGKTQASYKGTWELDYCEPLNGEDEAMPSTGYSKEDVEGFRAADLDLYMNLNDNGVAVLNMMGSLTSGNWEMNGNDAKVIFKEPVVDPETGEVSETNEATLTIENDVLKMQKDNLYYYFNKGEDKDPYADVEADLVGEDGLSILIQEQGEKLSDPITIADDSDISIVFDGVGVDTIGDPGYNMVVENKSANVVNVWVPDTVKVGDKDVHAYIYITLNPGQRTTTFLQLDTDEIESKSTDALVDISGTFQVDNAETGDVIGTYDFEIQ